MAIEHAGNTTGQPVEQSVAEQYNPGGNQPAHPVAAAGALVKGGSAQMVIQEDVIAVGCDKPVPEQAAHYRCYSKRRCRRRPMF